MDRIDIAPLAQIGPDGDVGDGAINAVVKGCGLKFEPAELQIEPALKPEQLLVFKRGISPGGDREHHERPVQFVQRWLAQAVIDRPAQRQPWRRIDQYSAAQ